MIDSSCGCFYCSGSSFAVQHGCASFYPRIDKGSLVTATQKAFSVEVRKDGIAVVTIDVPGESMNVLQATFAEEANAVFDDIANNSKVCLLYTSPSPRDA